MTDAVRKPIEGEDSGSEAVRMVLQDTELIIKARGGDIAAFEQLIYRYDRSVLTIAARFVRSSEDAKDIYQEVLLRVYKGLKNFKLQSEFSTWLFRITTNVCLTHQSSRKRHHHLSLDEDFGDSDGEYHPVRTAVADSPQPDQLLAGLEIAQQVQDAMEDLSPQQKMVFTLKHLQGMKIREIAVLMNCTEGTVKKHLFTATQRLRTKLHNMHED
jgi:RNA polymerase sigma-70 factor (ECF subfamily)